MPEIKKHGKNIAKEEEKKIEAKLKMHENYETNRQSEIHSQSSQMIHLLEEYHVPLPNGEYKSCISEAIKCHHNQIAEYLMRFLDEKESESFEKEIVQIAFRNCNCFYYIDDMSKNYAMLNII